MGHPYSHTHIWINGRRVSVYAIVEDKTVCVTEFEKSTFSFIRDWLSGKQTFELHTSGSTGAPKPITITRDQMLASAQATSQALQLKSNYNALVCLDTRYIAGMMMLVRCLDTGMKIIAVNPCANPLALIPVDLIIHFTALVPYQVKAILASKHPHLLDSLLTCIIGGAALDENTRSKLQVYTTQIFATYGMTETISHVALQPVNGGARSEFFSALPGITLRLDNRNCLIIRAPHLPQEVITNDIAQLEGENQFRWLGRWDNVINSGGIKVSPENLEERIGKIFTRLHIANPFFIVGIPDEKLGEKVALVMQAPIPDASLFKAALDGMVHSISAYEIPKDFFEVESIIFTNTSKIDRQQTFKVARPVNPPLN